ncbi:MAG: hypothetical protein ACT4OZ_09720 [Gemmatimonadota bacterium]
MARSRARNVALVVAVLTSSCSFGSGPASVGPMVAVSGLDGGRIAIVDVGRRQVVDRRGTPLIHQRFSGISFDSTTLFYTGGLTSGVSLGITALDVLRNRVLWTRVPRADGYALPGTTARVRFSVRPLWLAATPDTTELLVFPAYLDGAAGIARYRPVSDSVVGFLQIHVETFHVQVLRGKGTLPRGTLVINGTRRDSPRPRSDALFLIGPDLSVIDSVPLPPSGFEPYDVAVTPDERFAFVKSVPQLFKVDLAARQVVAQGTNATFGSLSLSPAGDLLVVTDPGPVGFPGSGKLFLYSSMLEPRGTIDLTQLSPDRLPPPTRDVAFMPDGTVGVVLAGTARGTAGQEPRLVSLFIVDFERRQAVSNLPLGEYGVGRVFMVR